MSGLYGHLRTDPSPRPPGDGFGPSGSFAGNVAEAARRPQQVIADADCTALRTLRRHGMVIGLTGDAIWRSIPVSDGNETQVLTELAGEYLRKGPDLLVELTGGFALAVLEPSSRSGLLAVDRMGVEVLAYSVQDDGVTFGTSARAVAEAAGRHARIRRQALFDFLYLHMVPAPRTVYEDVSKLPIASMVQIKNGRIEVRRYWQPQYRYAARGEFQELKSSLRRALEAGVRASGLDASTGAFLSGGLDSSSVAGTLGVVTGEPARTFTVGFGDSEHDELKFARAANRHFGNQGFEYQMTAGDIVDAFPRIATAYDEPFGNSSAAPTYICAKHAVENGITHVLAGDGGDELFGGNERYVRHWIFELYFKLPAWLRRTLLEPATRPISPDSRIMPLRKLRNYIDQALIPLPDRFESWNYMYREGGEHMLDPEFAESIDPEAPLVRLREVWNSAPSDDLLERMLWYDWQFTLADNDLRKVTTMCSLAGLRVSFPMLHPDVVDLSNRVPPDMKIEGQHLRSFFKKAMSDFLPREIIQKKKHGFALPFGDWMKRDAKLADLFYSHLTDLKKRRIVSAAFLDNLIEQHRTGHPSYYGYAIWDLAMLEAWLAAHAGSP